MNTYISLLRGINVGGHKKIKMDRLLKLYEEIEFTNIETYIQSGNVLFDSTNTDIPELTEKIEEKLKSSLDFDVRVVIRTQEDLEKIIESNSLGQEDISKLYVAFLSEAPSELSSVILNKARDGSEKFIICGKEIYIYYHNGVSNSKLSNNLFEKNLKVSATIRNRNTVNKLYNLAKQ